jgi:hypothetical protein
LRIFIPPSGIKVGFGAGRRKKLFPKTMKKNIKYWTLLLWFISATPLSPQNLESPVSLAALRGLLETNLNQNLTSLLNAHFSAQHFLITSDIELAPRSPSDHELPALPFIFTQQTGAPGLSRSLPEFWQQSLVKINRITINFLLDSTFSESGKQEMHRLIIQSAQLDLTRGDILEFEPILPGGRKATNTAPVNFLPRQPAGFSLRQLKPYLPVFAGILFLMFLTGFLFKIQKSPAALSEKNQSAQKSEIEAGKAQSGDVEILTREIQQQVEARPELSAKLLEYWIVQSPISGSQNCALFFQILPANHQRLLRNYFSNEKFRLVQQAAARVNPALEKDGEQVLHDFQSDFLRFAQISQNPVRCEDLVHFLQRQSTLQVELLLQKIDDEMKAIVLAQLPAVRAVLHLKIMPEKLQKTIVSALSRIDRISAEVYDQLARFISKPAQILIIARPESIDGLNVLQGIWEAADAGLRDDLLNSLRDSASANKMVLRANIFTSNPTPNEKPIGADRNSAGTVRPISSPDAAVLPGAAGVAETSHPRFRVKK